MCIDLCMGYGGFIVLAWASLCLIEIVQVQASTAQLNMSPLYHAKLGLLSPAMGDSYNDSTLFPACVPVLGMHQGSQF